MKKLLIIILVGIVVLISGVFLLRNQSKKQAEILPQTISQHSKNPANQKVDFKASFAIFTNGTFRIFTAPMYHNLSPDVYIEAGSPNIVNVKKSGLKWHDFFSTLPMTLTPNCLTTGTKQSFCTDNRLELKFYLNGERNQNALDQEIKNGDKLLVTFGTESEKVIKQQLKRVP